MKLVFDGIIQEIYNQFPTSLVGTEIYSPNSGLKSWIGKIIFYIGTISITYLTGAFINHLADIAFAFELLRINYDLTSWLGLLNLYISGAVGTFWVFIYYPLSNLFNTILLGNPLALLDTIIWKEIMTWGPNLLGFLYHSLTFPISYIYLWIHPSLITLLNWTYLGTIFGVASAVVSANTTSISRSVSMGLFSFLYWIIRILFG
jgi:hypothetical protein